MSWPGFASRAAAALVAALLVATLLLLLLAVAAGAADAAPSPSASAAVLLEGGDLRSEGAGPGIAGNPLLVLAAVVVLGAATALVTAVLARLARHT